MDEKKKENNILYVTHSGELLFWLLIVLVFVAFSSIGYIHKQIHDENDYQIFLPDVDGLIVGSPVRMMGIEVGHVVKIKPVKDQVYVKFILTNPDVSIPQGTIMTVEFSGMAGSKSLELYLPDKNTYVDATSPMIQVESPKRLRDALALLDTMYKKFTSIVYTCSSFGAKVNDANLKFEAGKSSPSDIKEFLNFSDKFLDESNQKASEVRKNIEGVFNNGK